jgi:hypothetical protein
VSWGGGFFLAEGFLDMIDGGLLFGPLLLRTTERSDEMKIVRLVRSL